MDPSGKKPSPPPPPDKKSGLFDNVKSDSKKKADFSNVQSGHSTTAPTPQPPPAPPPKPERTHTVASGDTLWAIAKKHLGEGKRWPEIYDKNKAVIGDNPDRIKPGQVLTIPENNAPGGKQ
jgi:nucleoid-associated protein YgaU